MRSRRRKKSGLGFLGKTMLFFNILAALLLLVSYLTPVTDPAVFWPVAFAGFVYPALILVNFCFVIYWMVVKRKMAWLSVLAIAIGWKFVPNQIGFRKSESAEMPKSSANFMRVLTYNAHYFKRVSDTYTNRNNKVVKDQMLDIIRKEQPDVICFQEFMSHASGEYDMEESVQEILHSNYFYFLPFNKYEYERIGLAIFSKYPIIDSGYILFSDVERGNEAIYADIKVNKKTIRIYNVHFQSIAFQPDDYKYMKDVEEINPDVQSSRRIASLIKRAFVKRSEQVKNLKRHTKDCTFPFVVAGDFNDTPISYAVNTMSQGLKNTFREKGSGFGNTYNGDFPNFQIDYILTTPNFEIKNYQIIKKRLSDHYPVRSDMELK